MSKKSQTFEENIERLEEIVQIIESGDVPLTESMKLFKEGTALIEKCSKILNEAELQVSKVTVAADGSLKEEAFDDASAV